MANEPKVLVRTFKMGATVLADVNPAWTPEQVLAAYVPNYPFLQQATLSEPVVEGDNLVFSIVKPAVQTKGHSARAAEVETALARIGTWADAPVANPQACAAWVPVAQLMERRLSEATTTGGCLDPLLIPMA